MFVSVPSIFLVGAAKQVPGVTKSILLKKKPTHTYNIQCVPRQKVNHKHLLSQGIFIQQPVFEEK